MTTDILLERARPATGFELRPYQEQAVAAILKSWEQFSRTLLVVPTAGGKTIIFAAIAEQLRAHGRILILAHRDELIEQARDKLYRARRLLAVREKAEDYASLDDGLVVASVQTLCRANRLERFSHDHFAYIITDESHHSLAASYQRIYAHFPAAKMLGVTATPDRSDKRNLAEIYEDIAFEINMLDLIKAGYLCPIRIETIPLEIDITEVNTVAGDYSALDLGHALSPYLEKIADILAAQFREHKTLVFLPLISISEEFADLCRARGLTAEHIDGTSPDRVQILDRFHRGENDAFVQRDALNRGL